MDLDDLSQARGTILIRKGREVTKAWSIYEKSPVNIRKFLKHREDDDPAFYFSHPHFVIGRVSVNGLWEMRTRKADDARLVELSLHSFRLAFALLTLRNRTDFYYYAKIWGHEGIIVLQRYLKQTYPEP
jgi:site-specific recombinase XerD